MDLKILIELMSNAFLFSSETVSRRKINPIKRLIPVKNAAANTGTDAPNPTSPPPRAGPAIAPKPKAAPLIPRFRDLVSGLEISVM